MAVAAFLAAALGCAGAIAAWVRERRNALADLTARQTAAERASQMAEERLCHLTKAINGWLWETDSEGRFVYISSSIQEFTGVPPEETYGKTRRELVGGGYSEATIAEIERAVSDRLPIEGYEYQYAPANNAWMRTSGKPYFDRDGRFAGYRSIAYNVDREKR